MTPQDAITRIQIHKALISQLDVEATYIVEALDLAIVALDTQIGAKPHYGCCPRCGADGSNEYGHKKYCDRCGQALNWSNAK